MDRMISNDSRSLGIGGGHHRRSRERRHDGRLLNLIRNAAIAVTIRGNWWAVADDVTNLLLAIPNEPFGAWMTSNAVAFADEVLILGLVKDVENVGNARGKFLQRLAAKALMARADDAIDATVSAGC